MRTLKSQACNKINYILTEYPSCWDNIKDLMTALWNAKAELVNSLLIPAGPNSFIVCLL